MAKTYIIQICNIKMRHVVQIILLLYIRIKNISITVYIKSYYYIYVHVYLFARAYVRPAASIYMMLAIALCCWTCPGMYICQPYFASSTSCQHSTHYMYTLRRTHVHTCAVIIYIQIITEINQSHRASHVCAHSK